MQNIRSQILMQFCQLHQLQNSDIVHVVRNGVEVD